jgi:hypothetical protein
MNEVSNQVEAILPPLAALKWFGFNQNNSGGRFIVDDNVSEYVFVQAANADDATAIAERFCDNGNSCPCCGDRWSFFLFGEDAEGHAEPMIYGKPMTAYSSHWVKSFARLHHSDGRVEAFPPAALAIADEVAP